MAEYIPSPGEGVGVQEREKVEVPRHFRVLLLNDHYTTMEFVVLVLEEVFHKGHREAVKIMLNVHENGVGVAGVYVKSVAEAKVRTVHQRARDKGFPLKCTLEPE